MLERAEDASVVRRQDRDQPGVVNSQGALILPKPPESKIVGEDHAARSAIEESVAHGSRVAGRAVTPEQHRILETAHGKGVALTG